VWDGLRQGADAFGAALGAWANPGLRLGVTGLSRAGKTVFITGMVHALVAGGRLPGFAAMAEGRISGARLVPHPDDAVPRFAYEEHLARLTAPERDWPGSTRQISALRLDITYQSRRSYGAGLFGPAGLMGGGLSRLALDIVDYPGEWLLDVPLLRKTYAQWSAETLAKAETGVRKPLFAPFMAELAGIDPAGNAAEAVTSALAQRFTAALRACREEGRGLSALAPGRFLMPGDLEGAPVLTFAPLRLHAGAYAQTSLAAMMERRFEAYKARVVKPFFTQHFARLDRQIVLVDVLSALNGGAETLADLETALADVLEAFKIGENSLLSSLFAPRISRILFAATKADHLHHTNHDRLEAILRLLVRRAWHRAQGAGSRTQSLALAAIRATREVVARQNGQDLPCIAGVPIAGEVLDGRVFDGTSEVALFPGDVPEDAARVFSGRGADLRFLRFRPPVLSLQAGAGFPGIRLDRALDYLLGDRLT